MCVCVCVYIYIYTYIYMLTNKLLFISMVVGPIIPSKF